MRTLARMAALVAVLSGVLGLLFGSFGNVVIHRVPEGRSVVSPPSACPRCQEPVRPYDNVPVLSWLVLRGRCRDCGEPISPRYPLVELSGGVLFAIVGYAFAAQDPPDWWALPGMFLFVWMLLVVFLIDLDTKRIPNALTYPLTPALAVLLVGAALADGEPGRLVTVLVGGLGACAFLFLLAFINPRGMGMGDVKFAAFLGLGLGYVGYPAVVIGVFGAFLLGSIISVALIATGVRSRKDSIPFGPFLSVGALIGLLFGPAIGNAYLQASGLA